MRPPVLKLKIPALGVLHELGVLTLSSGGRTGPHCPEAIGSEGGGAACPVRGWPAGLFCFIWDGWRVTHLQASQPHNEVIRAAVLENSLYLLHGWRVTHLVIRAITIDRSL